MDELKDEIIACIDSYALGNETLALGDALLNAAQDLPALYKIQLLVNEGEITMHLVDDMGGIHYPKRRATFAVDNVAHAQIRELTGHAKDLFDACERGKQQ